MTKYDFWMRQTLRERPAMILADWGKERVFLFGILKMIEVYELKDESDQWVKDLCRKTLKELEE